MRATTVLNFLLRLPGARAVDPARWRLDGWDGEARVVLRLTRKLLVCPLCPYTTRNRYDTREVDSSWRHLDLAGRVCRVAVRRRRPRCRLSGLVEIGVDEISRRRNHKYLTLVSDHDTSTIVWGAPGKDTATLEKVRRQVWQAARVLPDKGIAKTFKGARWALLKNPGDLTETQAQTLAEMKRSGGILWRADQLKEALRAVFAGDLDPRTVGGLLDRWCSRAQRSRIPEFIKAGRTIRKHRNGIDAAIGRGMSNGRHEGLNNKIRLLINRAYGFHSAYAALALIMLACGPVNLELPYHTGRDPHSRQ